MNKNLNKALNHQKRHKFLKIILPTSNTACFKMISKKHVLSVTLNTISRPKGSAYPCLIIVNLLTCKEYAFIAKMGSPLIKILVYRGKVAQPKLNPTTIKIK
jgi:hypothetical protein